MKVGAPARSPDLSRLAVDHPISPESHALLRKAWGTRDSAIEAQTIE